MTKAAEPLRLFSVTYDGMEDHEQSREWFVEQEEAEKAADENDAVVSVEELPTHDPHLMAAWLNKHVWQR